MAKTWGVTLPVAGHLYVEVEALSEEEAIEKAFNEATLDDLESWEAIRQFQQGNVSYCPRPWEAEAQEFDDGEEA
jgi:hypothetical protein